VSCSDAQGAVAHGGAPARKVGRAAAGVAARGGAGARTATSRQSATAARGRVEGGGPP
jgi:hypothetical protein